jgi:hypothetical protein
MIVMLAVVAVIVAAVAFELRLEALGWTALAVTVLALIALQE